MTKKSEGRILGIKGFKQLEEETTTNDLIAMRVGWTAIFYASSLGHGWGGTVSMTPEQVLRRLQTTRDPEEKSILMYALVTMKKSPLATHPMNAIVKPLNHSDQQASNGGSPELEAALENYRAKQAYDRQTA